MAGQTITIKVTLDSRDVTAGTRQIEDALRRATQSSNTFVDANGRLHDSVTGKFAASINSVDKFGASLRGLGSQARDLGFALTAGITAPLGLIAREVLRVGDEYQRSMNLFQAATHATGEQMQQAADVAKQLGADLSLPTASAGDAARTMTELAKSGLTASQAMDAARGTMLLAAAAGIEEARAAEIAGNALNAFHLEASEAGRVADLLAASANASSAEINDIALAMQQSSASAAALHIPIEDLTTAIAEMANSGIKGSDAGTSLKTALLALIPHSKKAREEMEALGLNVFDAHGKMLPLREVIGQVTEVFSHMTDQQKLASAQTIFGSDAMRAALIVFGGGAETFDNLKTKVTATGAAAELAGARTKGLGGAWEGLKSQLETGALVIFERMSPTLEKIVRALAGLTGEIIESVSAFAKANPGLAEFGIKVAFVAGIVGPLTLAVGGLIAGIGLISTPVLAAVGVIAGLGIAIAGVTTLMGKASPIYSDFNNTTLTQVRSANELVAVRQREIDKLQTYVNSCDESRDALAQVDDVYRKLDPIQRARVDLLASEARNTGAVTSKAAALLEVQRGLLEVERAQANLKLAEIAEDYLKRARNVEQYALKVGELKSQLAYFTRELENNTRAGIGNNVVTEDGRTLNQTYREALLGTSGALLQQQEAQAKNKQEFDEVAEKLRIAAFVTGTNEDALIRLLGVYDKLPGSLDNARKALRNLGIQQTEYGPAAQEAAAAARKQFETVGQNMNEGIVKGLKDTQGSVTQQITNQQNNTLKAAKDAVRAKSPAQAYVELGADMGDGLRIGAVEGFKRAHRAMVDVMSEGLAAITLKSKEISKAAVDFAKDVEKSLREVLLETTTQLNASIKTLTFQRATAEARDFGRALDEVAELQRELNIPVSQTVAVYKELNSIQRKTSEDEATFQRRRVEGAQAVVEGLRGVKQGIEDEKRAVIELNKTWNELEVDGQRLAQARAQWSAQANAQWRENRNVAVETINDTRNTYDLLTNDVLRGLALREAKAREVAAHEADVFKQATDAIKALDQDARDSQIRSRVQIADNTVFHSERATASILDHLARQKSVTETVADAFIGLYNNVFNKLDGLIDGWTSKLGIFGSFVGTLFKGIVNNLANSILSNLLGPNGILGKAINGIGSWIGKLLGGSGSGGGLSGILNGVLGGGGGAAGTATGLGAIFGTGLSGTGGSIAAALSGAGLGGLAGLLGLGGAAATASAATGIGAAAGAANAAAVAGLFGGTAGAGGAAAGAGGAAAGGLGGLGASIIPLLTNPITIAVGAAAAVGIYLYKRAQQRRKDESQSGEWLQQAIDGTREIGELVATDKIIGAESAKSLFEDSVIKVFEEQIRTLKTGSVRDSRLTNQVADLRRLFDDEIGPLIAAQDERIKARVAVGNAPGTINTGNSGSLIDDLTGGTSGGTSGSGGSDPFAGFGGFSSGPIHLSVEVKLEQGTDTATKVFVVGAKSKDGRDVVVDTVRLAAANGEL